MARLLFTLCLLLVPLAGAVAATGMPEVEVMTTDPEPGHGLGRNGALYIRFHYRSDAPIRVQARGYREGVAMDESASFNPAPAYPAGSGEGIAWVAYGGPTLIDEVRLDVFDASFAPLTTIGLPARFSWTAIPESGRQRPDWVARLSDAQQAATRTGLEQAGGGAFAGLVGFLVMLAVPGYFVLQPLFGLTWRGRWRLAALAPLVVMLPAFGHAAFALAAGSNIWPIVVILAAPFACLYLLALFVVRRVAA